MPGPFEELDRLLGKVGADGTPAARQKPIAPQEIVPVPTLRPETGASNPQASNIPQPPVIPAGEVPPIPSFDFSELDSLVSGVSPETPLVAPEPPIVATPPFASIARGIDRAQAGFTANRAAFFGLDPEEAAREIVNQRQQEAAIGVDPDTVAAAKAYQTATSTKERFGVLLKNPGFVGSVIGESLPASVPGMVLGGLGALTRSSTVTAAGLGAGSAIAETGGAILDFLAEKKGIDLNSETALAAALADQPTMEAARSFALKRGITIGTVDALTGFLSGKLALSTARRIEQIANLGRKSKTALTLGASTGGLGTETLGAAVGEAGAGLITEGQIDPGDVLLEAVGELGGGVGDVAVSTLAALRGEKAAGRSPSLKEIEAAFGATIEGAPAQTISAVEAVQAGRTLFGVDDGTGVVDLGTLEDARGRLTQVGEDRGRIIAIRPDEVNAPSLSESVNLFQQGQKIEGPERAVQLLEDTLKSKPRSITTRLIQQAQFAVATAAGAKVVGAKNQAFVGSTQTLGVTVPMRDLAGVVVEEDLSLVAVAGLDEPIPTDRATFDIDLALLEVGDVLPTPRALRQVKSERGIDFLKDRVASTSNPTSVAQFFKLVEDNQESAVRDLLLSGEVQFELDATLFQRGLLVSVDPTRRERVQKARVRLPSGSTALKGFTNRARSRRLAFESQELISTFPLTPAGESGVFRLENGEVDGRINPEMEAALKAGLNLLETLHKAFKIKQTVTIQLVGNKVLSSNVLGIFKRRLGLSPQIQLNGESIQTPTELLATLAHEYAHFLSAQGILETTGPIRAQIFSAYSDYLWTTGKITQPFESPIEAFGGLPRSPAFAGQNPSDPNYTLSFEEWFANQVGRWAITSSKPVGIVAKVSKPIARKILIVLRRFARLEGTNFRPSKAISDWLDSTIDGSKRHQWVKSVRDLHNDLTRTINEIAMRGKDLGLVAPMTEQSSDVRIMLSKLPLAPDELAKLPISLPRLGAEIDKFNWFYKWFLSMPQLATLNPQLRELQVYRELVELAHQDQQKIMGGAHERMRQWRRLGRPRAEALGAFLLEITQMNYRTPEEVRGKINRNPTGAEFNALVIKHGLDSEALAVYQGITEDFRQGLFRYRDLMQAEIQALQDILPSEELRGRLDELTKTVNALLSRPYFPMTRFGNWAVVARTGAGDLVHFETFESERAMRRGERAARAEFGEDIIIRTDFLPEEVRGLLGVPGVVLDRMGEKLSLNKEQKALLKELKFELSPAQSFNKRFLNRKGVAGFSEDAQRNYANYFFHHARHFMRVKYADQLRNTVDGLNELRKTTTKAENLGQIVEFLRIHMDEFLNPKADWAALRSMAAVFYLGLNAKSAALNLFQVPLGTAPYLSARFGDLKTLAALKSAALSTKGFYGRDRLAKSSDPEMRALVEAMDEGFINESQAAELAAMSESNGLLKGFGSSVARKGWAQFSHYSMLMFQTAEMWNRKVTFLAGRNLALANPGNPALKDLKIKHPLQFQRLVSKGWSELEALAFLSGKDATLSTQFEYARHARPKFMQGRRGVIFMFTMFTQQTLFMLAANKGVMPRYLLTMAFLGGLMGLPGAEDASDLVKVLAARVLGKDFDLELEARRFLVDILGDQFLSDIVLRGASRTSFGLPQLADSAGIAGIPKFDMSRAIGLGKILPVSPAALGVPGQSFERGAAETIQQAGGAAFGIGFNIWKASTDSATPWNDPKRWERALPSAARNAFRAFRLGAEGRERDSSGATVAKFDIYDNEQLLEVIGSGLGFQPTRLSQAWDRVIAQAEVNAYWDGRRTILMRQFAYAIFSRDKEQRESVLSAIRTFNKELPFKEKAIKPESLRRSIKQKAQERAARERGFTTQRSRAGVARDIKQLFPEATSIQKAPR